MPYISSYSHCYAQIPDEKGLFWLIAQFTMAGKSWKQEDNAAGHMTSTVRKQREMDAGAQLAFFIQSGTPAQCTDGVHI